MRLRPALPLSILLVSTGAAAAPAAPDPATLVPAGAEWALLAPRAGEGAKEAKAFLELAGPRAPLLRPASLGRQLERAVAVNFLDAAAWAAAGGDDVAPLAVASVSGCQLLSFGVKDPKAAQRVLEAWLAGIGTERAERSAGGRPVHVAFTGKSALAAWVLHDGRAVAARAVQTGGDPVAALQAAAAATAGRKSLAREKLYRAAALDGPWRVWGSAPRAGLSSLALGARFIAPQRLELRGRVVVPQTGGLLAASGEAFPGLVVPGSLAVVRMQVADRSLAPAGPLGRGLRWMVGRSCPGCDGSVAEGLARELARAVDGPVALLVDRLDVNALVASRGAPLEGLPLAYAVHLKDPAGAEKLLAPVLARVGAQPAAGPGDGKHWSAPAGRGQALVGIAGSVVYVATDAGARDRLVAALPANAHRVAARSAPLSARLAPDVVARALAPVSMTDVLQGGTLAALFGLKVEAGRLLADSGAVQVSARELGGDVFGVEVEWDVTRP